MLHRYKTYLTRDILLCELNTHIRAITSVRISGLHPVCHRFPSSAVCLCLWPLSAVCLSVTPDFPFLSPNSHPSYTAAQPVEERWACCQLSRAPVGQSISSIKDMLSTRVYPSGLEPLSPCPSAPQPHTSSVVTEGPCVKCKVPFLLYQHGTQAFGLLLWVS